VRKIGKPVTISAVTSNSGTLLQLLVTAEIVTGSLVSYTLMIEAICSTETSVLTKATLLLTNIDNKYKST
jgi:hypothetical protein